MSKPLFFKIKMNNNQLMDINIQQPVDPLVDSLIHSTPGLLKKLSKNCCTNQQDSRALICEVVKYLLLVGHSNEILTPSLIVDLAWHEFILFTRAYDQFCQQQFGRFIHHQPDDNKATNQQRYTRTLELYGQTFGNINNQFWDNNYNACGSCEAGLI